MLVTTFNILLLKLSVRYNTCYISDMQTRISCELAIRYLLPLSCTPDHDTLIVISQFRFTRCMTCRAVSSPVITLRRLLC